MILKLISCGTSWSIVLGLKTKISPVCQCALSVFRFVHGHTARRAQNCSHHRWPVWILLKSGSGVVVIDTRVFVNSVTGEATSRE